MMDWFDGLEPREQKILAAGTVFVVLFVIVWLIVVPLYSSTLELRERVESKQRDLTGMQTLAARLRSSGGNNQAIPRLAGSLAVLVQRAAANCKLDDKITNVQPVDQTSVRVRLESASFDTLVQCLAELQETYGLNIQQASFNAGTKTGNVRAQLLLGQTSG